MTGRLEAEAALSGDGFTWILLCIIQYSILISFFLCAKRKKRQHSSASDPRRTFLKKQTANDTEKNAMYSQTEKIRMFFGKLFISLAGVARVRFKIDSIYMLCGRNFSGWRRQG